MKVTVGGVLVSGAPLAERFNHAIEETNKLIENKNREIRRSKPMKSIVALLGAVTALGVSTVAKAEGVDVLEEKGIFLQLADKMFIRAEGGVEKTIGIGEGVMREDSVVWKMNDWIQKTLLNTQDFFDNPQVATVFNSIWYICMSFITLIVTKKGFDMVKARVLGTNSIGTSELIIRLLACVVMTFLSLDILQLGIELSNLTMTTLFSAIKAHLIPYEALEKANSLGLVFWFIGYCLMFVVLGIQYWIRQITIVMLGVLAPVANTSWVVDGGQMLGTLIRELITLLTTPIIHGLILGIGSVMMFEVTTATGSAFIDGMNSALIGFSTMFLMIVTPTFLRKFTTGSANPFQWALSVGKGTYGNAVKIAKFLKK